MSQSGYKARFRFGLYRTEIIQCNVSIYQEQKQRSLIYDLNGMKIEIVPGPSRTWSLTFLYDNVLLGL